MASDWTPDSRKRVADAVRKSERVPTHARPRAALRQSILPNCLAITTTSIGARSGLTPGSGTVQRYIYNGSTLVSFGSTFSVLNWTGASVPSGVLIKYVIIDGYLFYDGYDCSGVAP